MQKVSTTIEGAFLLKPNIFRDARGYFLEAWNREAFRRLGLGADFVQDNYNASTRGVLRGLHYQTGPAAQGKLAWVSSGKIFDVIVDLRIGSPTFQRWESRILDAETHHFLWVPPGCAHGMLVLSDTAGFHYKVTTSYDPQAERTLRWDDPDLAISWPLEPGQTPTLSPKDAAAGTLREGI